MKWAFTSGSPGATVAAYQTSIAFIKRNGSGGNQPVRFD
jgi:hypothetical protein